MTLRTGALALALVLAACAGAAAAQTDDGVRLVTGRELDASVQTLTDGFGSAPVAAGPGATVLMVRRDRDGEVEVHAKLADEVIVREGRARVLVGGAVSGERQTAPDERRGGRIAGGRTIPLAPGDVLWIPAGLPHQMLVERGTSFSYLVVKVPKPAAP